MPWAHFANFDRLGHDWTHLLSKRPILRHNWRIIMSTARIKPDACPAELKSRDQWLLWRKELRDGNPTKVPYQTNGQFAKSTDPATWCSFADAVDAYARQDPPCDGIGYAFSADDPFVGVDLDDCADSDGQIDAQAAAWINQLNGYAEISPSTNGVKVWAKGDKHWLGCSRKWSWPNGNAGKVEVYDKGRYFTFTGWVLTPIDGDWPDGQHGLDAIAGEVWPTKAPPPAIMPTRATGDADAFKRCLAYLDTLPDAVSGQGGSGVTLQAACECFRFGLSRSEAEQIMSVWNSTRCQPQWTWRELEHKLDSAEKKVAAEGRAGSRLGERQLTPMPAKMTAATPPPPPTVPASEPEEPEAEAESAFKPTFRPVGDLILDYPDLNRPIIDGLLRESETMNVIASPKMGKSWLVTDMALAVAAGRPWLGSYHTHQGDVLILDNELHPCTTAHRVPKVAGARGLTIDEYGGQVCIDNLRGRLIDIRTLSLYFDHIEPGEFKLIILDAFYRFLPTGVDENANADIAQIYNLIDAYAHKLRCAFVLIHHTSKGNQSERSVTDVGAGAGSQSRAADSHLILRPHQEDDVVVLDAAVRSWAPVEPTCLRWNFPVYNADHALDPHALKKPKPAKKGGQEWTPERFAEAFVGVGPETRDNIVLKAQQLGLSQRRARALLQQAEDEGRVFRWRYAPQQAHKFASIRQG